MCGRFTLTIEIAQLQQELNFAEPFPDGITPRYNIAPSQHVPIIMNAGTHLLTIMRWGFIPFWSKPEGGSATAMINARSETIGIKPAFKRSFLQRRCLVPADGFYEWKRIEGSKSPSIPFHFHRIDRKPFFFAGIWDSWKPAVGAEEQPGFAIITCAANGVVGPVHDRMPVMLDAVYGWKWLEEQAPGELPTFLRPYPADKMEAVQVSRAVNSTGRDDEFLVLPAGDQPNLL
jgi:putative SOS response-associated peptidase YedK